QQGSVSRARGAGSAIGLTRLRRRCGRGLVPTDAARRLALARSHLAAQARGPSAGLVALLFVCAEGLSQAGHYLGPDRSGTSRREGGEGLRTRSLSTGCRTDAQRVGHGLCLDLRTRRIRSRRTPSAAPPDHAPLPLDIDSVAG